MKRIISIGKLENTMVIPVSLLLLAFLFSCSLARRKDIDSNLSEDGFARLLSKRPELSGNGYKLVIAPVDSGGILSGRVAQRLIEMAGEGSVLYQDVEYYLFLCMDTIPVNCLRQIRIDNLTQHIIRGGIHLQSKHGRFPPLLYLVGPGGAVIDSGHSANSADRLRIYRKIYPSAEGLRLSSEIIKTDKPYLDTMVFIYNHGTVPGLVFETETTCSCTKAKLENKIIEPGDSVALWIGYKKRKPGGYKSGIDILTNSSEGPLQIVIESIKQ